GHTGTVRSLCWSAGGERVVSGSVDGTAAVWNVESGKTVLGPIKAHEHVFAVAYSPDTKNIATAGANENAVKIWDATTGELLSTLKHKDPTMRGHTGDINGIVHLPDGRSIITCSRDSSLRRWDLESGAQIGDDWRDEGNEVQAWYIALSPNGKTAASGSDDGTVRLWNVETEKVIAKWTGHTDAVRTLCWSADCVVSGSHDGTARVWNVESGKTVLGPIKAHEYVFAVVYSPDMKKIATGGRNENGVKIWDATTGE
ncbi:WD40 repeat-like protein, partial [Rhizopogon vinicolor AM-OR11-026]